MTSDSAAPTVPPPPAARAAPTAAWLLYTLIVLEILFMVSPAAAYYYAIYAVPLNALADTPATAWLTLHILPHFSSSDSALVNGLLAVSWPLIGLGLGLFLIGFVQIYLARLRQARGAPTRAVATGLYRYVRHPQYLALALVGLGTALFWSRYLVWIAYVTMLCLYTALARLEERLCLRRYGDDYRRYMDRSGRFLPRSLERLLSGPLRRGGTDAAGRGRRIALGALLVAVAAGASVSGGNWLRQHAIGSLQVDTVGPHTLLFLAPLAPAQRQRAAELLAPGLGSEPRLVYLAPAHWSVPELGLTPPPQRAPDSLAELTSPASHGNRGGYRGGTMRALIARPELLRPAAPGPGLLAGTVRIEPLTQLEVNVDSGAVSDPRPSGPGRWDGIPVPVY